MNQANQKEKQIYNVTSLRAAISHGLQPKYCFFWGHQPAQAGQVGKECFSQWWAAPFTVDGVIYPTAEHYMMAEKARLFGDEEAYTQILQADHPAAAKKLGRAVQGFDETRWAQHCVGIVIRGNLAKFSQHEALRQFLLQTGDRILVEASPLDQVWGIGLAENDLAAREPAQWPGSNLLGFALMQVREQLRNL